MLVSRLHKSLDADPLMTDLLRETYGEAAQPRIERLRTLCSLFLKTYGDGPVSIMSAPARINVLGEHIDYVSYIPTASLTFGSREHDMVLLFRPSEDTRIRGTTTLAGCAPFSFGLNEGPSPAARAEAAQEWERALFTRPAPGAHWGNYIRAAVFFARFKYGDRVGRGFDFLVDSSIPPAGGASSSSALTVLAAAAILRVNLIAVESLQLARDAARAEWYVGTRGGAMDHLTICLSRRANLVRISYSEETTGLVPLPHQELRLVTFFSHPADKSKEVMLEYNERAAVSRILIPAILGSEPGNVTGELEPLLDRLPEQMTLAEVEAEYPEAYEKCKQAFPALVRERHDTPLKILHRARHHVGEARRVAAATDRLSGLSRGLPEGNPEAEAETCCREIGKMLIQSHESLRDFYGVSTPEVERLMQIVLAHQGVYGARLMGGGFGGNVLVLTTSEHAPALIRKVQAHFYHPRGRDALSEGAIMVSTPGDGLSGLDPESAARRCVEGVNLSGRRSDEQRSRIRLLLDGLDIGMAEEIRPVIVAAGRGERAKASGLEAPKPLTPVLGVPAIIRVLNTLRAAFSSARPPVVVVSPETEEVLREALRGEGIRFVLQPLARGTGDAVLCTRKEMQDFKGRALVVWGTQPVLQVETVRRTLKLAGLFPEYEMIVPTAMMQRPYAPIERDDCGRVASAHETHLERVEVSDYGESNIGLFLVRTETMFRELELLRHELWREVERRYDRPRGELGFPNEMIRQLAGRPGGVFAAPIGDWREEKGIKTREDVELCEHYIHELSLTGNRK